MLGGAMAELQRERAVFEAGIAEWRRAHAGRFVLIHGDEVVGFYDSLEAAFGDGTTRFGLDPFFVQRITPDEEVNVSFFGLGLTTG